MVYNHLYDLIVKILTKKRPKSSTRGSLVYTSVLDFSTEPETFIGYPLKSKTINLNFDRTIILLLLTGEKPGNESIVNVEPSDVPSKAVHGLGYLDPNCLILQKNISKTLTVRDTIKKILFKNISFKLTYYRNSYIQHLH